MLIAEESTSYLMAVESLLSLPTRRTTSSSAKILHVLDGAIDIETFRGPSLTLLPGMAVSLGAGEWCSIRPRVRSRAWTIYAEEHFLRSQMGWLLPDASRVLRGHHPDDWDGRPLALSPGREVFAKLEPLWREISRLHFDVHTPEAAATRAVELLARWVRIVTLNRPDFRSYREPCPAGAGWPDSWSA